MKDYQRQVQYSDIITPDQVHHLFLNLNTLCDFQRRFLIGVEANASRPSEEQRFGHLFLQMVRLARIPNHHELDTDLDTVSYGRRTTFPFTSLIVPI